MHWYNFLDIAAGLILLGFLIAGVYEAAAFVDHAIPFTKDLPFITTLVRPWVAQHRELTLVLATLIIDAMLWLLAHFLIPGFLG